MGKVIKNAAAFAGLAFLLLGILFGMQIMTFIFANLGNSNSNLIDDVTSTVTNLTGGYINETGFAIPEASFTNFSGGYVVNLTVNATDGEGLIILVGNYTVNAATGVITNATTTVWPEVNLTYNWNAKTENRLNVENINNNSLQGIVSYTDQSSTQFSTVAIAITLIVLIALFLIFWKFFIKPTKTKGSQSGGNFG